MGQQLARDREGRLPSFCDAGQVALRCDPRRESTLEVSGQLNAKLAAVEDGARRRR